MGKSTHFTEWQREEKNVKPPKEISVEMVCAKCGVVNVSVGKPIFIKVTQKAFNKIHGEH